MIYWRRGELDPVRWGLNLEWNKVTIGFYLKYWYNRAWRLRYRPEFGDVLWYHTKAGAKVDWEKVLK